MIEIEDRGDVRIIRMARGKGNRSIWICSLR